MKNKIRSFIRWLKSSPGDGVPLKEAFNDGDVVTVKSCFIQGYHLHMLIEKNGWVKYVTVAVNEGRGEQFPNYLKGHTYRYEYGFLNNFRTR